MHPKYITRELILLVLFHSFIFCCPVLLYSVNVLFLPISCGLIPGNVLRNTFIHQMGPLRLFRKGTVTKFVPKFHYPAAYLAVPDRLLSVVTFESCCTRLFTLCPTSLLSPYLHHQLTLFCHTFNVSSPHHIEACKAPNSSDFLHEFNAFISSPLGSQPESMLTRRFFSGRLYL